MGLAATSHYVVNVGSEFPPFQIVYVLLLTELSLVTEAGPSAFANIGQNYYYVFIGCCTVYLFIVYFLYP